MCWFLNMLILCIFSWEIWREWDIIDDTNDRDVKVKCFIRLAIASVITFIAIYTLYKAFGITESNLSDYIINRRV